MFFFEVIGIIRRKSLIKELAAMYHAECLSYCQELLELQRKGDEVRCHAIILVSAFPFVSYYSFDKDACMVAHCACLKS